MRNRLTSILLILMFVSAACQPASQKVTPTGQSTRTAPAGLPSATATPPTSNSVYPPPVSSTASPTAQPASSSFYPPPASTMAAPAVSLAATPKSTASISGLNSVLLLDDKQLHKTITAYYDPTLWKAGPVETFNETWSGQVLTSSALPGCSLQFSSGFGPDPDLQVEPVSVQLNPSVTLYEIFLQSSGLEVLRLYRVDTYDSAFAISLSGVDAALQGKCVEQTEQVLASISVQAVYP